MTEVKPWFFSRYYSSEIMADLCTGNHNGDFHFIILKILSGYASGISWVFDCRAAFTKPDKHSDDTKFTYNQATQNSTVSGLSPLQSFFYELNM